MTKLYIIKERETGMYYRRIAGIAYQMVKLPTDATHFCSAGDMEDTVQFLNSLGVGVVPNVHNEAKSMKGIYE